MYLITISHPKHGFREFEGINKVSYKNLLGEETELTGEEIFTHDYPSSVKLRLFSDKSSYTINKEFIGIIEVTRAD